MILTERLARLVKKVRVRLQSFLLFSTKRRLAKEDRVLRSFMESRRKNAKIPPEQRLANRKEAALIAMRDEESQAKDKGITGMV